MTSQIEAPDTWIHADKSQYEGADEWWWPSMQPGTVAVIRRIGDQFDIVKSNDGVGADGRNMYDHLHGPYPTFEAARAAYFLLCGL